MIRELMSQGLMVQGITGRQGRMETEWMLESGTKVCAGVTPGRAGELVGDVPIFDSVREAAQATDVRVSMNYVPASLVVESLYEAVDAGLKLVILSAENVPRHGFARLLEHARRNETRVIGPNSQGIVVPGIGRWGCPGGDDPWQRFAPGKVAIVSRSGGLASEMGMLLKDWGFGTSVQISIGGSNLVGTDLVQALTLVEKDEQTDAVVMVGEPSGTQETEVANAVAVGALKLPIVAFIPGRAVDGFPRSLPFGHAPRGGGGGSSAAQKIAVLQQAGVYVARNLKQIRQGLDNVL